jgi:hypothetical protein
VCCRCTEICCILLFMQGFTNVEQHFDAANTLNITDRSCCARSRLGTLWPRAQHSLALSRDVAVTSDLLVPTHLKLTGVYRDAWWSGFLWMWSWLGFRRIPFFNVSIHSVVPANADVAVVGQLTHLHEAPHLKAFHEFIFTRAPSILLFLTTPLISRVFFTYSFRLFHVYTYLHSHTWAPY